MREFLIIDIARGTFADGYMRRDHSFDSGRRFTTLAHWKLGWLWGTFHRRLWNAFHRKISLADRGFRQLRGTLDGKASTLTDREVRRLRGSWNREFRCRSSPARVERGNRCWGSSRCRRLERTFMLIDARLDVYRTLGVRRDSYGERGRGDEAKAEQQKEG